ncbi:hypothetical protein K1X76_04275 [bacterium]|nr:hypothetical protein [bacterium]
MHTKALFLKLYLKTQLFYKLADNTSKMIKKLLLITFLLLASTAAQAHSLRVVSFAPSFFYLPYYSSFYYSPFVRPIYFTRYPQSYAAQLTPVGEALRAEWENYDQKTAKQEEISTPQATLDGSDVILKKIQTY